jgi:molybdenum cofactor cytidylyltransferase
LIAENPAWAEGVASSLRAGLNTLDQFSAQLGRAIVTLCDQPHLSAQSLSALLAAGADAPDALVAARYEGHPGAPALFGRDHFSALSQLTGDEGARTLFRSVPAAKITMVDLPQLSVDLDTPEDFHRITGQPIFD